MTIIQHASFKRDVKRMKKRGKDLQKLRTLIEFLLKKRGLIKSIQGPRFDRELEWLERFTHRA